MIEAKILEVRDTATCIPIVAFVIHYDNLDTHTSEDGIERAIRENKLRGHSGWHLDPLALHVCHLANGKCFCDAYDWNNRTMRTAHLILERDWDNIHSGDMIDVSKELGLGAVKTDL